MQVMVLTLLSIGIKTKYQEALEPLECITTMVQAGIKLTLLAVR